jgi:hypothetical protein
MKTRICDICEKPIKTWESVTYTERFIGAGYDMGFIFPVRTKRRITIDMCPECHKDFMDYLEACASVREHKKEAEDGR